MLKNQQNDLFEKSTNSAPLKNTNLKIIDLFAGIGGIRLGFEKFGCQVVFSSEWDKHAAEVYEKNFGEKPYGDITQINEKDIPEFDILCAGFPCQPFSQAGHQKGLADTRGTLFSDISSLFYLYI